LRIKSGEGKMKEAMEKPDYGNWVSKKYLYIPGVLGVFLLAISFLIPLVAILAFLFFIAFIYFAYARYRFSPAGGNLQSQIQDLVLNRLKWDGNGKIIDIGCGNAPLTIKAAKKYPHAQVAGIDYWGKMWEYSMNFCEKNAIIEGVADRLNFQKASASSLPFDDGYFDAAVSNLVFHEVTDTKNKKYVIKEALRVVKKGGVFAFQDLFLEKRTYGNMDDLLEAVRSWGIETVEFENTRHSEFIPRALKLPFMVGTIGILYGKK
jgi:ubiquinone/menaquinone biosynthesis C-methylase UbiE